MVCNQNAVKIYSEMFIKDIITAGPPIEQIPYFNILCFGIAGAGKSAFINSLMTALNDKIIKVAAEGGSSNHVTSALTRFSIKDLQDENLVSVPINIFDIWGMDTDNYQNKMFLDVLRGELPEGYIMKDRTTVTQSMANEKILKDVNTSKAERTIHSVIFFMPYNIEDNPKFTDALSENFLYCTRDNKMNPIVVVTRASMEGDSKAQEQLRLKIAEKFTLPAGSIFMYDNYTKEEDKTMGIDRKTLQILNHTINSSISYQKFYKSTLLDILYSEKKTPVKPNPGSGSSKPSPAYVSSGYATPKPTPAYVSSKPSPYGSSNPPPNPSPAAGLRCSACQEEVDSDWENCPYCTAPIPKQNICSCGFALQPKFRNCPKCKKPVTSTSAPPPKKLCPNSSCNSEVEDSWDICPYCEGYLKRPATCCNTPVRPNFAFCPKCRKVFPK